MENKYIIGIKIVKYDSLAKCIAILRKYNDTSISVLKSRIDNSEFVFKCDNFDESDVRKLNRCYKELTKIGVTVEIYDMGYKIPYQHLLNLIGSHRQTAIEVQSQMDAESDD